MVFSKELVFEKGFKLLTKKKVFSLIGRGGEKVNDEII